MTERYYSEHSIPEAGTLCRLENEEAHHLVKVMRARPGQSVRIFHAGRECTAVFVGTEGRAALLEVGRPVHPPAPPSVNLAFGLPWIKGGRTESVLQKLTELGASAFTIFHARREVVKGNDGKLDRLRRVVLEACKQSERADVPTINEQKSLDEVIIQSALPLERVFLLHERHGQQLLSDAVRRLTTATTDAPSVLVLSGPEGGFDPLEVSSVEGKAQLVSLGPRILRAETAPVAAAAVILSAFGDI